MKQGLVESVALLERFPGSLSALLRGLPAAWTQCSEGPGTYTATEVIAHLIRSEQSNWIPRLRMILEQGEAQPFPVFVRDAEEEQDKDQLDSLLDQFAEARSQTLAELKALGLTEGDYDRRGLHPTFGPVRLSQLLATWVAHDMTHLHQLSRILAHQYRAAVGPWVRFLGVLQCDGHSRQG